MRHRHLPLFIIVRLRRADASALQLVLTRTRFGSRLRAAVDDPRVARGLGINVNLRVRRRPSRSAPASPAWAARSAPRCSGLDPTFPLKFMIYFLIVVAVGGTSAITGPLLAALLLGIADVAGKYYVPELGAFIIYIADDRRPGAAAAGPVRAARDERAR